MNKVSKNNNFNIPVSLVIPVFGGERVVISQLIQCEKNLSSFTKKYEIIIADDHSKDNTPSLLKNEFSENKKFNLIFNKNNIGIARNIKKLYSTAKYEYICFYSADGDWNPDDIEKLITNSCKHNADIVIGRRNKNTYSLYRKVISFFYNFLPKILFQVDTVDAGSIKVIKKSLLKKIPLSSESVFFEAELIIRAKRDGYKISSIHVRFKRNKKKQGEGGKMKLVIPSLIDLLTLRLKI